MLQKGAPAAGLASMINLIQPHPPNPFEREVPKQFGDRYPERPADTKRDREARDLRAAFEVAGVGRGDAGGFSELFLGPAGGETELAQALSEDLCLDCHSGLSFNDR